MSAVLILQICPLGACNVRSEENSCGNLYNRAHNDNVESLAYIHIPFLILTGQAYYLD